MDTKISLGLPLQYDLHYFHIKKWCSVFVSHCSRWALWLLTPRESGSCEDALHQHSTEPVTGAALLSWQFLLPVSWSQLPCKKYYCSETTTLWGGYEPRGPALENEMPHGEKERGQKVMSKKKPSGWPAQSSFQITQPQSRRITNAWAKLGTAQGLPWRSGG